jgi:RNA 2',3'-cyclic 3'-phosphodiesterase
VFSNLLWRLSLSNKPDTIRAFLAIPVSHELVDQLHHGITVLTKTHFPTARPVLPDNMHITLKFFAELPAADIETMKNIMDQSAENVTPFQFHPAELSAFPNKSRPRVLWMRTQSDTNTYDCLTQSINEKCRQHNFQTDNKKNVPHITLARIRNPKQISWPSRDIIVKLFDNLPSFDVNSIVLIQSTLLSHGVRYDELYEVMLGRGNKQSI